MIHDAYPTVSLHNVTDLAVPDWADGGSQLCRLPREVRRRLNVVARDRVRDPTGCELRFVPESDDATVEVTLSARGGTTVHTFWGEFQSVNPVDVGQEPTACEFSLPERVRNLDADETGAFDPRVCRLRFDAWGPVAVHDVSGPARPPEPAELPDRRYLAYGTSITEGAVSDPHLGYVPRAAGHLGVDPLNLGMAGSAYCEPAIAEHLADRDDWDLATLAISVNMANRGFTVDQFRERAGRLLESVAGAHPAKPVVAITLFPYHADLVAGDDPERARGYRDAVRETVADSPHDNLSLVEGEDLLDAPGLMDDILHPGDAGMIQIGDRLADELAEVLGD
ncbi:MAG: GDSL-type esterase/lipase family protein [Haloarculaceae archaeon]